MKRSPRIGRREFLKRTSVGVVAGTSLPALGALGALATDALPRDLPAPPAAAGRLEPMALEERQLDSQAFCLSVYDSIAPRMTFGARSLVPARRWQRAARRTLVERLGGFPATRVALRPEVLEVRDMGTYTREKIVFQTREQLSTVGFLLLPKDRPAPLPVVICLPGHGRGVDELLGIAPDGGQQAQRGLGYSKEYAIQCVEHGYAVLAVEQLAFGYRRDAAARKDGPTANSCRPAACAALLFGQTMIGWRTWDAMRAIDYAATRPEIDARRVATLGCSSGGTIALFTAALDDRVKAAVVSSYFNTFRDSIVSLSHCPDNYVPGLLHDMEMYDLSGMVAPRPLFVESGEHDRIFPIQGFRTALAKARTIYQAFGASDALGAEIHDGAHEFHGVGAFEFLKGVLG